MGRVDKMANNTIIEIRFNCPYCGREGLFMLGGKYTDLDNIKGKHKLKIKCPEPTCRDSYIVKIKFAITERKSGWTGYSGGFQ
jgi:hypothetical protein